MTTFFRPTVFFTRPSRLLVLPLALLFFLVVLMSVQAAEDDDEKPSRGKGKKELSLKGQITELENERFITREESPVKMSATFYYGNADKETVPVLLLHDIHGSRNDFRPLIDLLVNKGYAVLAPDLRGHGKSTKRYEYTPPKIEMRNTATRRNSSRNRQQPTLVEPESRKLVDYLADDFQPVDHALSYRNDLPLLRNTLKKAHSDGLINMNRLVVIGTGRNCSLAAYAASQDWLDKDSEKFTKTLVLIAPAMPAAIPSGISSAGTGGATPDPQKFLGDNRGVREHLSILVAVPQNDRAGMQTAEKIREAIFSKKNTDESEIKQRFRIYPYSTEKAVKSGKDEATETMTFAETLKSNLGKMILDFIDQRNKEFKEKEARWTRLK